MYCWIRYARPWISCTSAEGCALLSLSHLCVTYILGCIKISTPWTPFTSLSKQTHFNQTTATTKSQLGATGGKKKKRTPPPPDRYLLPWTKTQQLHLISFLVITTTTEICIWADNVCSVSPVRFEIGKLQQPSGKAGFTREMLTNA